MGLDALLENQLGHLPKFQKLHIYSISNPRGRNWAYFHSMSSSVSERRANFQNCHIWAWNLSIAKCQMLHIYPVSTPGGQNWPYFRSTGSGFRDMGQFFKLPYLGMELGDYSQSARSCTCTLVVPQGVEIQLIFALRAAVSETRANF